MTGYDLMYFAFSQFCVLVLALFSIWADSREPADQQLDAPREMQPGDLVACPLDADWPDQPWDVFKATIAGVNLTVYRTPTELLAVGLMVRARTPAELRRAVPVAVAELIAASAGKEGAV